MAEQDRKRLLARALDLPLATDDDFVAERSAPEDADRELLRRIDDTSLRTKLVDARLAEGLQSPKGPQKIASIVRLYPGGDAPPRFKGAARAGRSPAASSAAAPAMQRGLPSVAEMERLLARYREIERDVADELASEVDGRIATFKRGFAELDGPELESAYRELGEALERKRALDAQIRYETFARIESDREFAERAYLRLLAR